MSVASISKIKIIIQFLRHRYFCWLVFIFLFFLPFINLDDFFFFKERVTSKIIFPLLINNHISFAYVGVKGTEGKEETHALC